MSHGKIWRLWNRATYSLAYVVAASRAEARCKRPDGATWDGWRWRKPATWLASPTAIGGGHHVDTPCPQHLAGWPDDPEDVLADEVAVCRACAPGGVLETNLTTEARDAVEAAILEEL